MEIEFDGFDELNERLEELRRRGSELHGRELLTPEFMQRHTDFSTFEEMLENSEWQVETSEDFDDLPDGARDAYVREVTSFDGWEDMLTTAAVEITSEQLGF